MLHVKGIIVRYRITFLICCNSSKNCKQQEIRNQVRTNRSKQDKKQRGIYFFPFLDIENSINERQLKLWRYMTTEFEKLSAAEDQSGIFQTKIGKAQTIVFNFNLIYDGGSKNPTGFSLTIFPNIGISTHNILNFSFNSFARLARNILKPCQVQD